MKILIGTLAAGALAVGGFFIFNNYLYQEKQADTQEPRGADASEAGKTEGSLQELAKRSGDWKCTVDSTTAQAISSGVTYVSGGKIRADFTTSVQGYGNVESHMLADGTDVYSWSSMMPQGIKTKQAAGAEADGTTQTSGSGMDANQSYSYDCQPWSADASLFAVPSDVTFRTL
jgi:hypothetical protein